MTLETTSKREARTLNKKPLMKSKSMTMKSSVLKNKEKTTRRHTKES